MTQQCYHAEQSVPTSFVAGLVVGMVLSPLLVGLLVWRVISNA